MQLPFGGVAMAVVPALAGWFFVIDYGGTFVIDWLGHKHALTAAAAALGRPLGSNALSMVAIGDASAPTAVPTVPTHSPLALSTPTHDVPLQLVEHCFHS